MKILVICQHYAPEPFRIARICEELAARGHEVHMVTGYPNYPEGELYPGYGWGKHIDETVNGVHIHRCFTIPRKTGVLWRFLNYYSFAFSARHYVRTRACTAADGGTFDVVLCNQLSPVMMAEAVVAYQRKYHVPAVLYCLDLWPESLAAGGVRRESLLYRVFRLISKRIYCAMDHIMVTSRMFLPYLKETFRIPEERMSYLPQFAEELFDAIPVKEPGDVCELVFAGNIGKAQSVDTILQAAHILTREPVRFHIVGGGTDLERLRREQERLGLRNVIFHGMLPLEEVSPFYEMADAMLVTMRRDTGLSRTLPGKVQSYLAAGKPILGAIDGETRDVIEQADCGYCGAAEDAEALAENIRRFMANADKARLASNARAYYECHFTAQRFLSDLEAVLQSVGS